MFDYKTNLKMVEEISYQKDSSGTYLMDRSDVYSCGVKLNERTSPHCLICKHWKGERGVGTAGLIIFKKFSIHVPASDVSSKCEIDGQDHEVTSKDATELGVYCKNFETCLPDSYNNLPETQVWPL